MKYLILFSLMTWGASCTQKNALKLHHKKHYTETNSFETTKILNQRISYNSKYQRKVVSDSWSVISLNFRILDEEKFKNLITIKLPQDSSIIKVTYDYGSVWNWEKEQTEISGEIELLNWTENKIELKENLLVKIENSKNYKFKGIRVFTKKEK